MKLVHPASLADTVRAIVEALFYEQKIPRSEALDAARWIAARQGVEGSYAAMFAPTTRDWHGIRLFTGERVVTRAGLSHVLGEEACRALRLLRVRDAAVAAALERADAGMVEKLHRHAGREGGDYCCGTCSVAVWRHLAAGGLDAREARLARGMMSLARHRTPDGRWHRFPFYYTLLALVGIDADEARAELRHAAPRCERLLARGRGRTTLDRRRHAVLERVLERVG